ncbi:solute carrier family 25 member 48-like [Lineus longissimus]|uniref:solute carrier family 25 member 48-like n=1 Tax=Lineus longissimus TaxID=88925 RepID=UPI002B4DB709
MKEAGTNNLNDWLAGACGGVVGLVVGFPLDTTKVQLQTAADGAERIRIIDMFKKIKTDGMFTGFFRGLTMPLCSYAFFNSLYFGVYGQALKKIREWKGQTESTYLDIMMASLCGGLSTLIPSCPIEVIKCTLQAQVGNKHLASHHTTKYYSGPIHCMASIFKQRGLRGLYKGVGIQATREVPASMVYLPVFVFYDEMLGKYTPLHANGIIAGSIAGGLSGVTMWTTIMPIDVIKTRLQSDSLGVKYKGIVDCAVKTYKSGGIRTFYSGLLVCAIRAFPCNAAILAVYKKTLHYLNSLSATSVSHPEVLYPSEREHN